MNLYDLSKLKMLIVEKQAPMCAMLRQILRELGVGEVFDATSPEIGYEEFNNSKPDLVLTDWAPDFDGLGLVRKIRNDETSYFPQVPIILATAYNETSHIYEALDAGITEYLSKPLSARLLYLRIASVIETPISQVNSIFDTLRWRLCYKNQYVEVLMEWLAWHTRWVNRNGTDFGSILTAA